LILLKHETGVILRYICHNYVCKILPFG